MHVEAEVGNMIRVVVLDGDGKICFVEVVKTML